MFQKNSLLSSVTLAIHGSSSALVKTTSTAKYLIDGVYGSIAAQDMPALSDFDIANGYSRWVAFYTDGTTESIEYSDEIANTENIKLADAPQAKRGYALLGWAHIKNASGANFDGGTTNLDASNITVVYIDNFGIQA